MTYFRAVNIPGLISTALAPSVMQHCDTDGEVKGEATRLDLHCSGGGASSLSSDGPGTHSPESIHFFSHTWASSGFIAVNTSCSIPMSFVSKHFCNS